MENRYLFISSIKHILWVHSDPTSVSYFWGALNLWYHLCCFWRLHQPRKTSWHALVGLKCSVLLSCPILCTLPSSHCILYISRCTLNNVLCTLQTANCTQQNCTLNNVLCTLETAQCTQQNCTLNNVLSTLQTAHCTQQNYTLNPAHCTLQFLTAHCTLHTVHCTLYTGPPSVSSMIGVSRAITK